MDSSALSMLLSARNAELERWTSVDGPWLTFWSILVFVGVALELWVICGEYRHDLREFKRGTIHSPERPSKRELLFELLAAVLVVVGILGELTVTTRIESITSELRRNAEELVSIADRYAADANKEAGVARKAAEDEALARVQIEARVAWRHLSDKQKIDIGSALARNFSNQGISLWYHVGDTEGSWFAADIADALSAAHTLRVYPPASTMVFRENRRSGEPIRRDATGVQVQSTNDDPSRRLSIAIVHELNSFGFDAERLVDPPPPNAPPQVWVNVEARPLGPQGEFKMNSQRLAGRKNKR